VTTAPKLIFNHGRREKQEERPIDWVWPNHLRTGTYVSFSGRQGTFKSTIAQEIAARYTTGRTMPMAGEKAEPGLPAGHVLFIHAEDDRAEVEDGFERAGGDFDRWTSMPATGRDGDPLNILEHLKEVEEVIREKSIRLVIIDGQNSVVGAPDISTDMKARNGVSNKLHQFAQRLNVCLIGIRNEDAEGRALGAQSMGDIARCVLRAVEIEPRTTTPYCMLKFVKVSDTARENYPDIPFSVQNNGGNNRCILWGKSMAVDLKGSLNETKAAKAKGVTT